MIFPSPPISRSLGRHLALGLLLSSFSACGERATLLEDTEPRTVRLAPTERLRYQIPLDAGDFLSLRIEQRGVDVVARLQDPRGETVLEVDRPINDSGPELLLAVATLSGSHRLEIEALPRAEPPPWETIPAGVPGEVVIHLDNRGSATSADRRRTELYHQFLSLDQRARQRDPEAVGELQALVQAIHGLGEKELEAEVTFRLAETLFYRRDEEAAAKHFERVIAATEDLPFWRLLALERLGATRLTQVEPEAALHALATGQEMEVLQEHPFRRARFQYLLGRAWRQQGAIQQARDGYSRALETMPPWEADERAQIRHDLGVLQLRFFGKPDLALALLDKARLGWESLGKRFRSRLAATWNQLGAAHESLVQPRRAMQAYHQALAIRLETDRPCSEANTRMRIALLELAAGRDTEALEHADRARQVLTENPCPRDETAIRLRLGRFAELRSEAEDARREYAGALDRFEALGDRGAQIRALVGLARACRHLETCTAGPEERSLQAQELFEVTRSELIRADDRIAYGSLAQELFDLRIALQWESGEVAGAFASAEHARARGLRERLRQVAAATDPEVAAATDPEVDAATDPEAATQLGRSLRPLQRELGSLVTRRRTLELRGVLDQPTRGRLEVEIEEAVGRLERLEERLVQKSPRIRGLLRPPVIRLGELQRQLDTETTWLEYRLGEEASYLWQITAGRVTPLELPSRARIEEAVEMVRSALVTPGGLQESTIGGQTPFRDLAHLILPEGLDPLQGRRLVFVADGALETIPFAVLPEPGAAAVSGNPLPFRPLVDRFEILHLPSAAVWAELRARPRPEPRSRGVAVIADPAYRPPRDTMATEPSPGAWRRRLPHSRGEAQAILASAPHGEPRSGLFDFEATKAALLGGSLDAYRYLHFAGHAEANLRQPLFSYLAFSQFAADGSEIASELYAHELYGLRLTADLVVLSACSTGLGRSVPGEGLVSGLPRGFLYAGARGVMVSLWPVSDRATPELMESFYPHLFTHRDPAQSLHLAQRRQYRNGRPPYEWAGFVLQGDWRVYEQD